jgi:hypothetical protein
MTIGCFILISESEIMRYLGFGILCMVFLTLNQINETTPNPKLCLCTQMWNETLPRHEFCGKELGRGCDPNTIYNCIQYGTPAILGYHRIKLGGRYRQFCSPTAFDTYVGTRNLLRCKVVYERKSSTDEICKHLWRKLTDGSTILTMSMHQTSL